MHVTDTIVLLMNSNARKYTAAIRPQRGEIMTTRPPIDNETIERINSVVEEEMTIPPEAVGVQTRLEVLLDILEQKDKKLQESENTSLFK